MEEEFVSVSEAARRLGVSRATIWRAVARAGVPTFDRPGERATLIRVRDLDRLRQPRPRKTTGDPGKGRPPL